MKIKTKSIKKITSVVLTKEIAEEISKEWLRYSENPNSVFSVVVEEDDGNVSEFVLLEDQEF